MIRPHDFYIQFLRQIDWLELLLEVKQDEHMEKIKSLVYPLEEDEKIVTYYPDLHRVPNRRILYLVLQYTFFCYLFFYMFELVKTSVTS